LRFVSEKLLGIPRKQNRISAKKECNQRKHKIKL
jgi:hypothetical protein